ncbi:hypothetical protein [Prevotella falsenii]
MGFFLFILIGIVAVYELNVVLPGSMSGDGSLMYVQFIMQPLALLLIPLALYLFKFPRVSKSITNPQSYKGFRLWACVRICLLCIPIILNMFFYYIYGEEVGFFYLALILTISLFFIYPTKGRCESERNFGKDKTDQNNEVKL